MFFAGLCWPGAATGYPRTSPMRFRSVGLNPARGRGTLRTSLGRSLFVWSGCRLHQPDVAAEIGQRHDDLVPRQADLPHVHLHGAQRVL